MEPATGPKQLTYAWYFWFTAAASLLAYGWAFYCLRSNSISRQEAGLTVAFYVVLLLLGYLIDRLIQPCRRCLLRKPEQEETTDPTFGLTQFSIEEIYEANLRDQIGMLSKVKETKTK